MANVEHLITLLENVHLNGTITECVLNIEGDQCICQALSISNMVFVECGIPFRYEDDQWAIGDITTLLKYLKAYQGYKIDISRKQERLIFKPKGGSILRFLSNEPSLIPTYSEKWEEQDSPVLTAKEAYDTSLELTNEAIGEALNIIRMINPNSVNIVVSKKGKVTIIGGTEADHQFDISIGSSDFGERVVKVDTAVIVAVLAQLDFAAEPKLMVGEGTNLIIENGNTTWVVNSVDE